MNLSQRIEKVPPYLFVGISRKIAEKKRQGIDVVSFGIGDPDIPTPASLISTLRDAAMITDNHRYPETEGLPEFRSAVANWYKRRFDVTLDPETEILSLIGAKEGIGHASLCFIDPGDIALVPDPGYPVYSVGTWFAGGECYWMPLLEENRWLPNLAKIPNEVASKAKVMWLNYPNNPTGALADLDYFKTVVDFAKANRILVMHDACYTEVAYDGTRPHSFLEVPGAMDVSIEFHSLSKSYNMTGWRLGVAVGNSELINALMVVKSNLDSGVPQAIQMMGIDALNAPVESVDERNTVYQQRRDRLISALAKIGLHVDPPKASLYVWAQVPKGYSSAELTEILLEERNIVVTPGSGYGKYGEGYIRLSLTISEDQFEKGLDQLEGWVIPSKAS